METLMPDFKTLIEYTRSGLIEQSHSGIIVHMNKHGIINKIGRDNNYKFFMRSCMKPMQFSACIDAGVDIKYEFSLEETAVCCASHAGDKLHQKYIMQVLKKAGFSENDLLCPAIDPLSPEEKAYLVSKGLKPHRIHNNCSGKHAAMLALCAELGFPVKNYTDFSHPLTGFVISRVCILCGADKNDIVTGTDGCTLPVIAVTLEQTGRGFLNLFTNPEYSRIKEAFLKHPVLIGGRGRLDTEIMLNSKNIIAKTGACGLAVIVNLEKEEALIIKTADALMEARSDIAFELLRQLEWTKNDAVHSRKNDAYTGINFRFCIKP